MVNLNSLDDKPKPKRHEPKLMQVVNTWVARDRGGRYKLRVKLICPECGATTERQKDRIREAVACYGVKQSNISRAMRRGLEAEAEGRS